MLNRRAMAGRPPPRGGRRAMGGFSLLEVMIAVLVLSIGLLGLAGLQMHGLQTNHSAVMRSQATFLAYDILDSMRANAENLNAYQTDFDADGSGGGGTAGQDLASWKTNLANLLPGVDHDDFGGRIQVDGNRNVTVTIRWPDARWEEEEAEQVQTFEVSTRL